MLIMKPWEIKRQVPTNSHKEAFADTVTHMRYESTWTKR